MRRDRRAVSVALAMRGRSSNLGRIGTRGDVLYGRRSLKLALSPPLGSRPTLLSRGGRPHPSFLSFTNIIIIISQVGEAPLMKSCHQHRMIEK